MHALSLFKLTVQHPSGQHEEYVVAPDEIRAEEVAREMVRIGDGVRLKLERINDSLPDDRRRALDPMLDMAPVGLAYYNMALGWIAQPLPLPKLKLFKAEVAGAEVGYVAAPDANFACAVFWSANPLQKGEQQTFRICDAAAGMPKDMRKGLDDLLECGPISMVTWSADEGWIRV